MWLFLQRPTVVPSPLTKSGLNHYCLLSGGILHRKGSQLSAVTITTVCTHVHTHRDMGTQRHTHRCTHIGTCIHRNMHTGTQVHVFLSNHLSNSALLSPLRSMNQHSHRHDTDHRWASHKLAHVSFLGDTDGHELNTWLVNNTVWVAQVPLTRKCTLVPWSVGADLHRGLYVDSHWAEGQRPSVSPSWAVLMTVTAVIKRTGMGERGGCARSEGRGHLPGLAWGSVPAPGDCPLPRPMSSSVPAAKPSWCRTCPSSFLGRGVWDADPVETGHIRNTCSWLSHS